nr:hypothetical protein CFP56_33573 [Quercus suber]
MAWEVAGPGASKCGESLISRPISPSTLVKRRISTAQYCIPFVGASGRVLRRRQRHETLVVKPSERWSNVT